MHHEFWKMPKKLHPYYYICCITNSHDIWILEVNSTEKWSFIFHFTNCLPVIFFSASIIICLKHFDCPNNLPKICNFFYKIKGCRYWRINICTQTITTSESEQLSISLPLPLNRMSIFKTNTFQLLKLQWDGNVLKYIVTQKTPHVYGYIVSFHQLLPLFLILSMKMKHTFIDLIISWRKTCNKEPS